MQGNDLGSVVPPNGQEGSMKRINSSKDTVKIPGTVENHANISLFFTHTLTHTHIS